MLKNVLKIIAIFVIGTVGGIFADQILWPYFIERPLFYKYRLEQAPIYITEKNEIIVQENIALQNAVEEIKKRKVVVGIRAKMKTGRILEGSGLVVTSDGLVVTLAELVPEGADLTLFIDGKTPPYQIIERDLEANLALIKIKGMNLSTVGFADFEESKLGERVFLIGIIFGERGPQRIVNEGIIKFFAQDYIRTNIFEKNILKGSPLFNIKGRVVGLNTIDSEGKVTAIPVEKIREFIYSR